MSVSQRVTLKHLRAFEAVATERHFTRAADKIGLSQPALSALISQLEEDLSVQLLHRTTRAVDLTPAGREFLASAIRIIEDVHNSVNEARDHALLHRGRLRIAALPSLCTVLLPEVIREFRDLHPGITLSVLDAQGDEIVSLALGRQIDFGIGFVGPSERTDYEAILTDRLVAVGSFELLAGRPETLRWKDLAGHEVIAMTRGTTVRRLMDEGALGAGIDLRIVVEPRQMQTAIAYARAGLGVAILPTSGIPSGLGADMVCATLVDPLVERTLSILSADDAPLTPPAARFLELLRQRIELLGHHPGGAE